MAVVAFVGMDAFKDRLKLLHQNLSGKILREATYAGANVIRNAIASGAPGEIGRSIIVHERQVRKFAQTADDVSLLIGPEKKKGFYALWVESGFTFTTGLHVRRRTADGKPSLRVLLPGGRWVTIRQDTLGRKIPGKPFIRPAFDSIQGEALTAAEQVIARGLEQEGQ